MSQNFSISSENLTTVGQTTTTVAPLVTSVQMSSEKWSTVHRRPTTVAEVTSQRFISPVTTSGRSFSSSAPVPLSSPCNTTCFVAITVILVVVVVVVVVVMWFFIRRRRSLRLRQPETLPMPDTLNGSTQREPEAEQLPQPPLVTAPPSPMSSLTQENIYVNQPPATTSSSALNDSSALDIYGNQPRIGPTDSRMTDHQDESSSDDSEVYANSIEFDMDNRCSVKTLMPPMDNIHPAYRLPTPYQPPTTNELPTPCEDRPSHGYVNVPQSRSLPRYVTGATMLNDHQMTEPTYANFNTML